MRAMDSACEVRVGVTQGGRAELSVTGELDLSCDADLRQAIDLLRREGVSVITVDASGLQFIDSNGLGVLMRARSALRADLGDLTVRGATEQVRRVFELAGLHDLLQPPDG
jgi:anti-sigma B factor antagonist